MASKADLVAVLRSALVSPERLEQLVKEFQTLVWATPDDELAANPGDAAIPRDLAYDLDFFVSDHRNRAEDASYFGPERAGQEIEAVLERLGCATNG